MSDPAFVVREFLRLLALPDSAAAVDLLAEDVVWRNTGLPTFRGKKRVGGMLRDMERRNIGLSVRMHHLAADGDIVLTDRTDILKVGRVESAFWVCGTFEVRDGLIVLWDDHFATGSVVKATLGGVFRALRPKR